MRTKKNLCSSGYNISLGLGPIRHVVSKLHFFFLHINALKSFEKTWKTPTNLICFYLIKEDAVFGIFPDIILLLLLLRICYTYFFEYGFAFLLAREGRLYTSPAYKKNVTENELPLKSTYVTKKLRNRKLRSSTRK